MEAVAVGAEQRPDLGKGPTNRLRRQGFVPAVIYGENAANLPISIPEGEVRRIPLGPGKIFRIAVAGEKEHSVLVRELQKDPVTGRITHLDLLEVSMTQKLTTTSAIRVVGEAKGVQEGDLLQYGIREVEIECLPADLPEGITVDISTLEAGENLKVKDLTAPPGVTILTEPDKLVVSMVAPQMGEAPEEEQEEQGQEAAPADEADPEQ